MKAQVPARSLRTHLKDGGCVVSGWCMIPSSVSAEIMGRQGFDAIAIDLQHGLIDYQTSVHMLQALARFGVATFCRIPSNDRGIIGKALDAGFTGIICPMVNDASEAEALVRACSYAPRGFRSYGPIRARRLYGSDYVPAAASTIMIFAMIETVEGVRNLDGILAVEGIDGTFIGPADLALSMGHEPTLTSQVPEVVEAIQEIRQRTLAAGKVAGIHCGSGEDVNKAYREGYRFIGLGNDVGMLETGIDSLLGSVKSAGERDATKMNY